MALVPPLAARPRIVGVDGFHGIRRYMLVRRASATRRHDGKSTVARADSVTRPGDPASPPLKPFVGLTFL
jgi:hypothetical protein